MDARTRKAAIEVLSSLTALEAQAMDIIETVELERAALQGLLKRDRRDDPGNIHVIGECS